MTAVRIYDVPEISCDHCKQSIESGLGQLEGVESVAVDIDRKTVEVTGSASNDDVRATLDSLGYGVAGVS